MDETRCVPEKHPRKRWDAARRHGPQRHDRPRSAPSCSRSQNTLVNLSVLRQTASDAAEGKDFHLQCPDEPFLLLLGC